MIVIETQTQPLARAIGQLVAGLDHNVGLALPRDLDPEFARAVARSANATASVEGDTPLAIVVTDQPATEDLDDVTEVTPGDAVAYRAFTGQRRVFVLHGQPVLPASLTNAVQMVLTPSFPADPVAPFTLDQLAEACIDVALASAGRDDARSRVPASKLTTMQRILETTADLHRQTGSGSNPWNFQWYHRIDDGLSLLVDALTRAQASRSIKEVLEDSLHASFTIPSPVPSSKAGQVLDKAIKQWWSDADQARATIALLRARPDTESAAALLEELEWDEFDRQAIQFGDVPRALATFDLLHPRRLDAFGALGFDDFINPTGSAAKAQDLVIAGDDGLELPRLPDDATYLVAGLTLKDGEAVSDEILVRLPLLGDLARDEDELARSGVTIHTSPKTWAFEPSSGVELDDLGPFVRGRVRARLTRGRLVPRPREVSVAIPPGDVLEGHLDSRATGRYLLLPPVNEAILAIPLGKRGNRAGNPIHVDASDTDGASVLRHVTSGEPHVAVAWAPGSTPELNGQSFAELAPPRQAFMPTGDDTITAGSLQLDLAAEASGEPALSPVIAALRREAPSTTAAPADLAATLRADLESVLADVVDRGDFGHHGHLLLPTNRNVDVTAHQPILDGAMLAPTGLAGDKYFIDDVAVPVELRQSDEARQFQEALVGLELGTALERDDEEGTLLTWPSRTSWAHLWRERDRLAEYLQAHEALVRQARSLGNAYGVLWAAYPFSASLWKIGAPMQLQGVLLSPLHPLRLAWLAAVEATLADAPNAGSLAGLVEGWNFPIVGPANSLEGRLLALPIDNGPGQVFLGWSMLVEASPAAEMPLFTPATIAGRPAPGTTAGGLNAGGVETALVEYLRMYPHVTTMVIDLAAEHPIPRLEEIDAAILNVVVEPSRAAADLTLLGGARVHDSIHRAGTAPRDTISRLRQSGDEVPVTWTRYDPSTSPERPSNVRILQDGGVALSVKEDEGEGLGVAGSVPLRRFEVSPGTLGPNKETTTRPSVRGGANWPPFRGLLDSIEMSASGNTPKIKTYLTGRQLVRRDVDWTVTGEAMASPAAIASLVGEDPHEQVLLWEWRPPLLENRDIAAGGRLERRPYVSVVKVPRAFSRELGVRAGQLANGTKPAELASDVMRVLGGRGLGLSSLLAMGGSHATGALGFYSVIRLTDRASTDHERLVLPIDVCDRFLTALAGASHQGSDRRRADLLVVDLKPDEVTLVPVEIKCYGLATPQPRLPKPGSAKVQEALKQVSATARLLDHLVEQQETVAGTPGEDLFRHGLASLVEIAMRLDPGAPDAGNRRDQLAAVLDGTIPVRAGRPLLAYLLHDATTSDGGLLRAERLETLGDVAGIHGELIVNAKAAVAACDPGTDEDPAGIASAWNGLLEWASMYQDDGSLEEEAARGVGNFQLAAEPTQAGAYSAEPPVGGSRGAQSGSPVESTASAAEQEGGTPPPQDHEIQGGGIRLEVGSLSDSLAPSPATYWPSNTALNQLNVGVVGDLGTGKTQLLRALVLGLRAQAAEVQPNSLSMLVFDYKQDFQDPEFLSAVGGHVLDPHRIPLDVLGVSEELPKHRRFLRAQAFIDIITRIYGVTGGKQRDRLLKSILGLYDDGVHVPTLANVLERYEADTAPDVVTSVLNKFVLGEILSDDPAELVPFDDLINDRVLVVNLHALGTDQHTKDALVVMFLNRYYDYMQRLQKWPYEDRHDVQLRRLNSYLLVDEATNIMEHQFPVLEQLLLQGREFGVGVILSSQYLRHFRIKNTNYGETLRTWFIHQVPDVSQSELSKLGLPEATRDDADRISQLGVHEAYYSSLGFEGRFMRGHPYYELREGM